MARAMSIPQALYHGFRRSLRLHMKSFTLVMLIVFITLNLLVYLNFDSFNFFDSSYQGEIAIDRRETSLLLSDPSQSQSQRPFKTSPTWIQEWFQYQRLSPELNAENYDVVEGGLGESLEGTVGGVGPEGETRNGLKIDVVYTWVNGTDEVLQRVKEQFEETSPLYQSVREFERKNGRSRYNAPAAPARARNPLNRLPADGTPETPAAGGGRMTEDRTANRFRDMDELKYSVRSVAQYASRMFERIHILTTESDPDSEDAQIPSWLNLTASRGTIELVHHDRIFERKQDLPSFNSLSIESQMHHIPGITDVFLYLNDDVFLGQAMSVVDVWTPLYGFVFHMEPSLLVSPTPLVSRGDTLSIGEWNSLQYSNYLLSKQFGARHRSYIAHVPHVLSAPMLHEIQTIWPEDFAQTSSHRFRGEGEAKDVQVSFFMAHYVIERLRETQLESYWRYRLDANQDGLLDWDERAALVQRIQHWNEFKVQNHGYYPSRPYNKDFSSFLNNANTHQQQLGFEFTGSSTYKLSGQDGYPFMIEWGDLSKSSQLQANKNPYMVAIELQHRSCYFDLDFCLGPQFLSNETHSIDTLTSTNIFQRLAFTEFHCGDCLLHILRQTGGPEPGLQAEFLPMRDQNEDAFKQVTSNLAKYNYVIATSDYSFVQLTEPFEAQRDLSRILMRENFEAFFCINDNVSGVARVVQQVQQVFREFLETRFPVSSPWENSAEDEVEEEASEPEPVAEISSSLL
ncbi:Xanthine phosphoribosyltransferase 1 [Gryganskiella cystojenkinii]|nr:Xanthine phosphoribosyltransferase 1 [Gryganskiella cystojenkinii]